MKLLLFVLFGLACLVTLLWGVGLLIPPNHVASRSVHLARSPEVVWEVVSDLSGFDRWAPEVTGATRLADRNGHPVWAMQGKWAMPLEVEEISPPERMVTRIADPKLPFGGTWTWEIAPAGNGCLVTLTERGEIKSAFFRTLSRFVFGYTSTLDSYLKALGKRFDEDVSPTAGAGG